MPVYHRNVFSYVGYKTYINIPLSDIESSSANAGGSPRSSKLIDTWWSRGGGLFWGSQLHMHRTTYHWMLCIPIRDSESV